MKIRMFNSKDDLKTYVYQERKWLRWHTLSNHVFSTNSPIEAWNHIIDVWKDRYVQIEVSFRHDKTSIVYATVGRKRK